MNKFNNCFNSTVEVKDAVKGWGKLFKELVRKLMSSVM